MNARSLKLQCALVLHEALLLPVLSYGMERGEVEDLSCTNVQTSLIKLLGIRRMDRELKE